MTETTETAKVDPKIAAVTETAAAATAARLAFHRAVKAAAKGASLRTVAAAASVSPEQVRRIVDGRAK